MSNKALGSTCSSTGSTKSLASSDNVGYLSQPLGKGCHGDLEHSTGNVGEGNEELLEPIKNTLTVGRVVAKPAKEVVLEVLQELWESCLWIVGHVLEEDLEGLRDS